MVDPVVSGPFTLAFSNGHCAQALWLEPQHTALQALDILAFHYPQPTLVLIGGAGLMTEASLQRLKVLFDEVLAPLAQELQLVVIDGGTNAGVMRLMGQARHRLGGTFPLVGVLPQGQTHLSKPALASASALDPLPIEPAANLSNDLEPHHSAFIFIPGKDWGSESSWISDLATAMSGPKPALTLLINGGQIAALDLHINLAAGRPVLALAGSGRLADDVALALGQTEAAISPDLREIIQRYHPSGALLSLDIALPAPELRHCLRAYFKVC